jgi:AcrR family transcriptional regulator
MAKDAHVDVDAESGGTWRELAVARSLDPARARAEKRVQRFLDAALELMNGSPDKEFTVQEVVERSGQSLRSFYQYFAGKYELLLALFEESVRSTAEHLQDVVDDETDPLEKVHAFVVEYFRICQPLPKSKANKSGPTPALSEFAQRLLTEHPKEASRAFGPMVGLLEGLLDDAAAAGHLRPGLDHRHLAGTMLQAVGFNAFAATISGAPVRNPEAAAEELWSLLHRGIGS